MPSGESRLGLRWQAWDDGPTRDTALDSKDLLDTLIRSPLGSTEGERRRRCALPAHSINVAKAAFQMPKLQ